MSTSYSSDQLSTAWAACAKLFDTFVTMHLIGVHLIQATNDKSRRKNEDGNAKWSRMTEEVSDQRRSEAR